MVGQDGDQLRAPAIDGQRENRVCTVDSANCESAIAYGY